MGTKTIRVREEVYDQLRARKRPDESFSDLLDRLSDHGSGFEQGFGAFSEVDFQTSLDELDEGLGESFRETE